MDIIESQRSTPRGRLLFFLLAAIVVIGLAIWVSRGPRSAPSPSTLESPVPSASFYGFLPRWPQGPPPPASLAALVAPVKPPRAVDPAHGTAAEITGISDTPQGKYAVTEVGGGYVVTVHVANPLGTGPEPPTDAYLVSGDLRTAKPIGRGSSIAVGADGRSVLVAGGAKVIRHGLDGSEHAEATLPPDQTLVVETVAGLLIAAAPVGPWEIWDPRTGQVRQRFPQLFAASTTTIAYGTFSRAINILNLSTGATLETEIPDRELTIFQAALSRDGRYLATQLTNRGQWQHLIAVFDTKLALWVTMPGTPFAALNQMALGWSGSTLVLARIDEPAVVLWNPGDSSVYSARIT